jgi:hypothetical protein
MKNPWKEIENKQYILSTDLDRINEFNNNKSLKPEHKIQTQLIPDPFFGNKKAKVVLLMLNPGFGGKEEKDYEQNNFDQVLLNNLKHSNSKKHFFSLDKAFEGTDAHTYWKPRVKELNDNKFDNDFLSEQLFCINLFPYHSEDYKKLKGGLLESQKYALFLLNEKINEEGTLIISMRAYTKWSNAYSEVYKGEKTFDDLVKERKILRVSSYGNPTLSYKNLLQADGFDGFKELLKKLKEYL